MQKFASQVLGGTQLDRQGERVPLHVLQNMCEMHLNRRVPLHMHHDMNFGPCGYIDNIRLVPHDTEPGEWSLVGDVTVERGDLHEVMGGFSISYTELIHDHGGALCLYLPYPFYNDDGLVGRLISDGLSVGKWVKKAEEPASHAILYSAYVVAILQPIWGELFKEYIAPSIRSALSKIASLISDKRLTCECVQIVTIGSAEIELRFIPASDLVTACLSPECIEGGIRLVRDYLESNQAYGSITRIVLTYDRLERAYEISRVECALNYASGSACQPG